MTEPSVGDLVDGRYHLQREIARGGMGVVFEAEHVVLARSVAVKMLTGDQARTEEARSRLLLEARALTAARHPNVVAVLDAGIAGSIDLPYLTMELLEGRPLDGILAARRRVALADALQIGRQLLDALAFAHERGIVHRDVKPGNLFLARDDTQQEVVKLVDFGTARVEKSQGPKITLQGALLGTPEYMAPEQLLAKPDVDHRADIYAAGVLLYECLAGAVPFEGTYGEILLKASTEPLPKLSERCPDVPATIALVIETALAREAADRWQDARSFQRALLDAARLAPARSSLLGIKRAGPPPLPGAGVAAAAPGASRRRWPRAPYVTPVRIVRAQRAPIDGRSEDISEGGLLVTTEQPCENGEIVRVRFALPTTGRIVECEAVARWVHMARRTGAQGLELRDPVEEIRSAIRQFVAMMGGT